MTLRGRQTGPIPRPSLCPSTAAVAALWAWGKLASLLIVTSSRKTHKDGTTEGGREGGCRLSQRELAVLILFDVLMEERGGMASESRGSSGHEGRALRGDDPSEKGDSVGAAAAALHAREMKAAGHWRVMKGRKCYPHVHAAPNSRLARRSIYRQKSTVKTLHYLWGTCKLSHQSFYRVSIKNHLVFVRGFTFHLFRLGNGA